MNCMFGFKSTIRNFESKHEWLIDLADLSAPTRGMNTAWQLKLAERAFIQTGSNMSQDAVEQ